VNLLRAWGVLPAAVVGHSSGEIAAAYTTGALTQDEAITIAYYRGFVTQQQTHRGAMAAVGLGRNQTTPLLRPGLVIACENSASSVTVSGDEQALEKFLDTVKESAPDVLARRLRVGIAYHSRKTSLLVLVSGLSPFFITNCYRPHARSGRIVSESDRQICLR
jgi:acyl transferase domain-containing protein